MAQAGRMWTTHGEGWRVLAWIGVALQAAAFVAVLWSQRWNGAGTIAGFFALSVGALMLRGRLPNLFAFLVVSAAMINAGGWSWNWFKEIVWFDEFVHLYTSFVVVAALGWIARAEGWLASRPGGGRFIALLALGAFGLGVLWEVFEMTFLNLAWSDTVVDLVMDTLGGAAAGWFLGAIAGERRPLTAQL